MNLPIYEFTIDEDDEITGMQAISLVDQPAMESQFIKFNKAEKVIKYKFQDEVKRIVAGLALIPYKLVYRFDEETGEEYLAYFSQQTIEAIMNKFMREATNGYTKNINLQHSDNKVNAHLIESFIIRTPEMLSAIKAMGIEDACIGAWYVAYKFDDMESYQKATEGIFTGFSVEVMLDRELIFNKNKIKNKNNFMGKIDKLINKFKTILNEFENINLEDVKVKDSDVVLRYSDVGQPVLTVSIDEAGAEVTAPTVAGEYVLENGSTIAVDDNGNLLEIKEGQPVPIAPEDMNDENLKCKDKEFAVSGDTKTESGSTSGETSSGGTVNAEDMPMPEVPAEETPIAPVDVTSKTLGEIVDVNKDGEYYINVVVQGGKIVEAYVEVEQALVKADEFTKQTDIITELNKTVENYLAEIEDLKVKLSKPVVKPIMEFTQPKVETKTKEELKKMNNLEFTMHRLGLNKD